MPGSNSSHSPGQPHEPAVPGPSRRRRIAFRLCAVLLSLSLVVLLEFVLRAFELGNPQGYADPLVGFSGTRALFELDERAGVYRTARGRQLFFEPQQFSAQKPAEEFRVFCLGGSTVRGRPYQTATGFLKWLTLELSACDPDRVYEAINCGGLSYASYRLVPILREVLQYEPDLIIVATGHNEFLEERTYGAIKSRPAAVAWMEDHLFSLRTVTLARQLWPADSSATPDNANKTLLPEDVQARLDRKSGYAAYRRDDPWHAGVIHHFEQSLRTMVELCRRARVPLLLVNLGANLRDCPPFKSEHRPELEPGDEYAWEQIYEAATQTEKTDPEQALSMYRRAEAIDGEHALLVYRIARCLDQLGRRTEARDYYYKARDLDICPLRMVETLSARLQAVAEETSTPWVDARRLLADLSTTGIPGHDWFLDHCHPTIAGHQQMARAIADKLRESGLVPHRHGCWNERQRRTAYQRHFEQLGPAYLAKGGRRVAWLESWAARQRLYDETIPQDPFAMLRLGHRQLNLGDHSAAFGSYQRALSQEPSLTPSLLDHALRLCRQGRPDDAATVLAHLRDSTAGRTLRGEVELAALILALDQNDTAAATAIYRTHQHQIHQVDAASFRWLELMPDALAQADKLPESTPAE